MGTAMPIPDIARPHAATAGRDDMSLADALDRILHRGVSLQGNLTIGLADVDLLYLDLRVLLGSVDTIWPDGAPPVAPICPRASAPEATERPSTPASEIATRDTSCESRACAEMTLPRNGEPTAASAPAEGWSLSMLPQRETPEPRSGSQSVMGESGASDASIAPADVGAARGSSTAKGLVRLVLTVVKLLHDVLERQAVRRMEAGRLTEAQIDNLGSALLAQAQEILCLQRQFGFSEKDLSLNLGVSDGAL